MISPLTCNEGPLSSADSSPSPPVVGPASCSSSSTANSACVTDSPGSNTFLNLTSGTAGIRFSGHTLDKATKAKVTLENYYSNLISQHKERKHRYNNESTTRPFCT